MFLGDGEGGGGINRIVEFRQKLLQKEKSRFVGSRVRDNTKTRAHEGSW